VWKECGNPREGKDGSPLHWSHEGMQAISATSECRIQYLRSPVLIVGCLDFFPSVGLNEALRDEVIIIGVPKLSECRRLINQTEGIRAIHTICCASLAYSAAPTESPRSNAKTEPSYNARYCIWIRKLC